MKQPRAIIFDFDGTLANTEPIILTIYAEIAEQKGWPPMTKTEYKKLRKSTVQQGLRWLGIRPWQIPGLLREAHRRFHRHIEHIQMFDGLAELVASLHGQGDTVYVLSANSRQTIDKVLARHQLSDKVTVLKSPPLLSKHKSIQKLIKKHGYAKDHVWMIGDELRDIDAARKAGVPSIAVTWGLQDSDVLRKAQPTHVATKPREIAEYLDVS